MVEIADYFYGFNRRFVKPANKRQENSEKRGNLYRPDCKMPYLERSFAWSWNLVTSESGRQITWKFRNVVLKKDGKNQLDRSGKTN